MVQPGEQFQITLIIEDRGNSKRKKDCKGKIQISTYTIWGMYVHVS